MLAADEELGDVEADEPAEGEPVELADVEVED